MDIKATFSYPFEDKDWPVKMIIGIALSVLPIINFFCLGYAYKIFKDALDGKALALPEWDGWGDLFVTGLIIFCITVCYFLIPLLLAGTGGVLLIYCLVLKERGDMVPPEAVVAGLVILGVGLILVMVVSVIFPMALAVWSKNGEKFLSAFKLWEIIPNIFRAFEDYIVALILLVGIYFAFLILCLIPYLGLLFAVVFSFYLKYLFSYGLWGKACRRAFAREDVIQQNPAT